MTFSQESLDKTQLICPKTKTALVLEGDGLINVDPDSRLKYSIQDDIPVMLVDEAVELSPEEWADVMRRHGRDPQTGQPAGGE